MPRLNKSKKESRTQMVEERDRRLKAAQQTWRADYTPAGRLRPTRRRKFSRLGQLATTVQLASKQSIVDQLPAGYLLSGTPRLTQRMASLAKPYDPTKPASQSAYRWLKDLILAPSAPGTTTPPDKKGLQCVIQSVTCIEETTGFCGSEWGADEIRLGGMKIGPDGIVREVASFKVKDFEEDGAVQTYQPPDYQLFCNYSLTDTGDWPRVFFATFVLAEIDMGGLGDFLSLLVDQVKLRLAAEIATAVGAEAAAAIAGVVAGVVAAAIVVVLMVVVFVIVVAVFSFLKSVWEDDVFDPVTVMLPIDSAAAANQLNGAAESQWGIAGFAGHGGVYQLRYTWRAVASAPSGGGSAGSSTGGGTGGGTQGGAGAGGAGHPPTSHHPR